jgi:hypothetical protein
MNRFTLASRAATSMFRKPVILVSLVPIGLSIERDTEPSAASCKTYSTPSQARAQSLNWRMSASTNVKLVHCCALTRSRTWSRLRWLPVAKLSRPVTHWFSLSSASTRLEPIKPAAPVTSQW